MRRRELIGLIGATTAWPLMARAQQVQQARRIGILLPSSESDAQAKAEVTTFQRALQALGWTDGGTAQFQIRWAGGQLGQIGNLAKNQKLGVSTEDRALGLSCRSVARRRGGGDHHPKTPLRPAYTDPPAVIATPANGPTVLSRS
jgi:hypothetical protein